MLPEVSSPGEWLHPQNVIDVAEHLLDGMTFDQPREALEMDIIRALSDSDSIEFEWGTSEDTACELLGTYTRKPARIRVSRNQNQARANFTAAHEFGHHLQQSDFAWALDVLADLRRSQPRLAAHIEEAVSNQVAARLLVPQPAVAREWSGRLTPAFVRALTRNGTVSRQAASIRASAHAQAEDPNAVIIVADPVSGMVISSISGENSTLARPAKGSIQPDFRHLSTSGEGQRGATEGFHYTTGSARSDITYDWGWDVDGTHLLIIARPTYQFGDAQWDRDDVECMSATCESSFPRDPSLLCRNCFHHRCPDCGSCACEKRRGTTCANCGMEMSLLEAQRGEVHEECPF